MHRIAAATLLLTAALASAACEPPRSDATAQLDAVGLQDGELWIGVGATVDLWIVSEDPRVEAWSVDAVDPEVLAAGAVTPLAAFPSTMRAPLASGDVGDTTLVVSDADGATVEELAVRVRHPEGVQLAGACGVQVCAFTSEVRLLPGDVVLLSASYLAGGRMIAAPPQLALASDPAGVATLSVAEDLLQLVAPPPGAPAEVTLTAGPLAGQEIAVTTVPLDQVVAAIDTEEDTASAGDELRLWPRLLDAAGAPIATSRVRLVTPDGELEPLEPYVYDPAAAPTEVQLVVGAGAGAALATTTIHRAVTASASGRTR